MSDEMGADIAGLEGVRVLVVEDEPLLLVDLLDVLADLGTIVVASASHIERALPLARTAAFDIAVLDVNIGLHRIDEVAEVIAARGIPLLFATGYGLPGLSLGVKTGLVEKPYEPKSLDAAMIHVLAGRGV